MRLSSGNVYILFHLRCVDNLRTIHKNVLTRADYIFTYVVRTIRKDTNRYKQLITGLWRGARRGL